MPEENNQSNNQQNTEGNSADQNKDSMPLIYDEWLKAQPDEVKTLLDSNTKGLKGALESERESRKKLEKELRDMAGKADKGSEAQNKLNELADQVSEADRRAEFYEAAHQAGVTNLKLAYLVAQTEDLFDRRGQVNFEAMKAQFSELFGGKPKTPAGNAGTGTDGGNASGTTMNQFIRKAAGR